MKSKHIKFAFGFLILGLFAAILVSNSIEASSPYATSILIYEGFVPYNSWNEIDTADDVYVYGKVTSGLSQYEDRCEYVPSEGGSGSGQGQHVLTQYHTHTGTRWEGFDYLYIYRTTQYCLGGCYDDYTCLAP